MKPSPLPSILGPHFSTHAALAHGVPRQRLRRSDLRRPFHGVRLQPTTADEDPDRYRSALERELTLIRALSTRLVDGQFLSHRSAALIWGAPMPYRMPPQLHVSVARPQRSPRIRGVHGHSIQPDRTSVARLGNIPISSPEFTFVKLGDLSLTQLVAVGDYLLRDYRQGYGRPNAGKPPLTTRARLADAVSLGHWNGAQKLRRALELVREDSWSPRESMTRLILVQAGLPEPELNVDLFDSHGDFLGCVDMVYRKFKVIVEYQGEQHGESYAQDLERVERLRAAGWEVIQVTRVLAQRPIHLAGRVESALRARGWQSAVTA